MAVRNLGTRMRIYEFVKYACGFEGGNGGNGIMR